MARSAFPITRAALLRRPGGVKKPLYNMFYGPPIFAPLLFAACGFLGIDGQPAAPGAQMRRKSFPIVRPAAELTGLEQPGYYPGYSTLAQKEKLGQTRLAMSLTERVGKTDADALFFACRKLLCWRP